MYLFGFAKNYVLRSITYVASPLVEIEKNITICHQSVGGNREICILKLPPDGRQLLRGNNNNWLNRHNSFMPMRRIINL